MGLSNRQYDAHHGVSHTEVAKALATGRITAEADGTIDPTKADTLWDRQTVPCAWRDADWLRRQRDPLVGPSPRVRFGQQANVAGVAQVEVGSPDFREFASTPP